MKSLENCNGVRSIMLERQRMQEINNIKYNRNKEEEQKYVPVDSDLVDRLVKNIERRAERKPNSIFHSQRISRLGLSSHNRNVVSQGSLTQ